MHVGALYIQVDTPFAGPDKNIVVQMHGTTLQQNYAEIAGGACYVENLDALVTDCKLKPAVAFSADTDFFSDNFNCDIMVGNTVGSGGYGPSIASPATSFYAMLAPEKRNGIQLGSGSIKRIRYLKPGDVFPPVAVVMVDSFHQGPALVKTLTGLSEFGTHSEQQVHSESFGKATIDSEDGLILNPTIADVSNGYGVITVGEMHQQPGDYSLVVWAGDDASSNITLQVSLSTCSINEQFIEDAEICSECDKDHFNFLSSNISSSCELCPDECDCTFWGLKPHKNHWIPSPCSTAVKECLSEDACDYGSDPS